MEDKKPEETNTSLEASDPNASASLEADQNAAQEVPGTPGSTPADGSPPADKPPKKPGGLKAVLRKVNVYLLLFALIVVVAGVIGVVSYLNSKKPPAGPDIATQQLTENALKQLANSDATVGDTGQTLTVQGNAIFSGQVLVRSNLNVAGTIQLGGDLTAQNFTASGTVTLANTQIQGLQVANGATFKGAVTAQNDLNVAGTASFNGAVTASQLTVSRLILSGNAVLQVPDHLAFTGPSPGRSFNTGVLGSGGSASVSGSDTSGTINVNTGGGTRAGCFITVNFSQPFAGTPHVIISPVGSGAGQSEYYATRTSGSMSVCFAAAPPAHQSFAFDYFVAG